MVMNKWVSSRFRLRFLSLSDWLFSLFQIENWPNLWRENGFRWSVGELRSKLKQVIAISLGRNYFCVRAKPNTSGKWMAVHPAWLQLNYRLFLVRKFHFMEMYLRCVLQNLGAMQPEVAIYCYSHNGETVKLYSTQTKHFVLKLFTPTNNRKMSPAPFHANNKFQSKWRMCNRISFVRQQKIIIKIQ